MRERAARRVIARNQALRALKRKRRTPSLLEGLAPTYLTDQLKVSKLPAQERMELTASRPLEEDPRFIEGLSDPVFSAQLLHVDARQSYYSGYDYGKQSPTFGNTGPDEAIAFTRRELAEAKYEKLLPDGRWLAQYPFTLGDLQGKLQARDDRSDGSTWQEELLDGGNELRRLEHYVCWTRRDPIEEIPPGVSRERSLKIMTGISETHTESMARALGLKLGVDLIGIQSEINEQLTEQVGNSVSISQSEEVTTTLRLENQTEDQIRLYALWQQNHRLRVSCLTWNEDDDPSWELCSEVEFMSSDAVNVKMHALPAS